MVKITIDMDGKPNHRGDGWYYDVYHDRQEKSEGSTFRARNLDNHYLLEQSSKGQPYEVFGVKEFSEFQQADERLYARAKTRAKQLLDELAPEIEDSTGHSGND